jgi:MoaA/NifB/PqqE/SkfB family radical SAM enzyme
MLDFCHLKKMIMAAIFVQDPNPILKGDKPSSTNEILFRTSDRNEVVQMADYLISKKKAGYQLLEPIEYYESVKNWINGKLEWRCDGGKYALEVDTDGTIGICGYLPYLKINVEKIRENFFIEIKKFREKYQKWCTKKCLPSCMFCSSFYRQNPLIFLYSKLRYS